jgi:hypothetical protein
MTLSLVQLTFQSANSSVRSILRKYFCSHHSFQFYFFANLVILCNRSQIAYICVGLVKECLVQRPDFSDEINLIKTLLRSPLDEAMTVLLADCLRDIISIQGLPNNLSFEVSFQSGLTLKQINLLMSSICRKHTKPSL